MASLAVIAPQLYAAAISPVEWPTTTLGRTFQPVRTSINAIWMAVHNVKARAGSFSSLGDSWSVSLSCRNSQYL